MPTCASSERNPSAEHGALLLHLFGGLPLTPNGKVDKRALPEPVTRSEERSFPATETERALARIWAEVLGRETGVNEHFFEVGGHSLKVMGLTARDPIRNWGKEVPLSEVFARPTIREMAAWMDDQEQRVASEIRPVGEREHYPVSAAQRRMYIAQQLAGEAEGTVYNIPVILEVIGELDADRLETAFRRLIDRHESLRTSFHMDEEDPCTAGSSIRRLEYGTGEGEKQGRSRPEVAAVHPSL